jgi:S1-C subfamily serine protease
MDSLPPPPSPERSTSHLGSRLPILIGILLALLALLYLPTYMQNLGYERMRGEVQAIDESLGGDLGKKFGSLSKAFVVIAQKSMPSVVHIDTRQRQVRRINDIFSGIVPEMEGEASGVIVDPAGYIVTNNHVVKGAEEITITLSNGKKYDGVEVVNTDEAFDLALVKIDAKDLVAADWGDSDQLDVGEMVLAIGNPYGLDRSVTFGIVSGKNRHNGENESDFLQTDAAVNPGNSGGPLVNMAGKIIGINTAIVGEQYQGISLAIPSNTARKIYEQLKSGQATESGFLGVNLGRISPQMARQLGLRTTRGALVMGVVPKSPAERAGIQVGDVITSWDDHEIDDRNLLILLIARTKVGTTVPVTVNRNGETIKLDVAVTARPKQLGRQPQDD